MMVFMIIQSLLFLFMVLHDWVDIPLLTDLFRIRKSYSFRFISSLLNAVPLLIATFLYINAYRLSSFSYME